MFLARGLPGLKHFSCLPGAQCEASRAPGQGRNLLGQAHRIYSEVVPAGMSP